MPLNPPPGWLALQEKARQTKDPQELAAIIDEMNELLTEYENTAGDGTGDGGRRASRPKSAQKDRPRRKGSS